MAARLFGEFTSDNQIDYVLEIHDTDFTGAAQKINIGGEGFTLKWDGITDEIYSRIIGSSVSFGIYDEGQQVIADFLTDFKQYQEERFYIVIYREADARYVNNIVNVTSNFEQRVSDDGGTVESPTCYRADITDLGGTFRYIGPIADHIYWYGWIVQDLVAIEDESNPTLLTFQANDGITKMGETPYEYDGVTRTFADHLYNFINDNTPASNLDNTLVMFRTIVNYWAEQQTYSATSDPLRFTRFQAKTYANYTDIGTIEYSTALEILQEMCVVMGSRFYFDDGCYRFEQFSERTETEIREFKYLMTGVADGYDDVGVDYDVDQTAIARSQGNFRFLPAVNKIQLTDIKKANANILGGTVTYDSQFGDEINVGLVPSANNGRIYLEMTSRFQTYINTPTTGTAVPVFSVTVRLEPEDGTANQYWTNSLVSGVASYGPGSWGTTFGVFNWAANSVTRQQSTTTLTKYNLVTGPIPKDGEIFLDITILGFIDAQGSSTSFFTGGNSFDWAVTINKARFENDNSSAAIGKVIGFATNTSSKIKSNLTLDLGETRLFNGSGELGSLNVYDGSDWVPSGGWRVGNSGSYENTSSLVTSDLMQFHNNPIERWEGVMIYPENFYALLRFDSHDWIALRGTLTANSDELQGEWFRISKDNTNISIGTPIDVTDTDFGDNGAPDAVGQYANISVGDIAGMGIDADNNAVGPYQETATGGQINGTANVTGNTTLAGTLGVTGASTLATTSVGEFTTTDRVNVTINEITGNPGGSETISLRDHFNFVSYSGANGSYTINLPSSEDGVILRFKTDDTVLANKTIDLQPQSGERIDAEASYTMDRSYDGISLLGKGGNWFIIQKKEK